MTLTKLGESLLASAEELTSLEDDFPKPPDSFDPNVKEVIFFELDDRTVITHHVDGIEKSNADFEDPNFAWGALGFESFYGELGWDVEQSLSKTFPKYGYFVMEGAELSYGHDYYNGESYTEFYAGEIRPATLSEIREQFGEKITFRILLDQFKAAWKAARLMEDFE